MKKILALMTTLIMCMTLCVIPAMAMETTDNANVVETSTTENTIQPRGISEDIIYPAATTFSTTKTITNIHYTAVATNADGFIQVRFTNLTTGYIYNRVFVTDGCSYDSGANMAPGNYKIETTGGNYGILWTLTLNFS